jgi:RNA polymerase sigma factor (sigma-70 family)
MAEELLGHGDPSMQRLQQAFAHEEPAIELASVLQRAARYQAEEPPAADHQLASGHGLTAADLTAARRREPAAVTRIYTAYAPALWRFFLAAVDDRHHAEELTGATFVSAVESLAGFSGPVDAFGGWLFQIARHDLDDYRRRQARSRVEPLEHSLDEAAAGTVGPEALSQEIATQTVRARQAVPGGEGVVPTAMLPQLFRRLLDMGDRATDAPLNRLSPREREVLALLGRGWSNAQIGRELYISPHTVRTHVQNILQKLEMHSKLEAATFAMQHELATGRSTAAEEPEALVSGPLEDARVMAALRELPADQREVLLLGMAAGLTAPEVAAILDKTVGAVKALQHRGRARLARVLEREHPELPHNRPSRSSDSDQLT